jgi:hypothetical protein
MEELAHGWRNRLAGASPRVVLTDGDDPRTAAAARQLAAATPVQPVLLSDSHPGCDGVEVLPRPLPAATRGSPPASTRRWQAAGPPGQTRRVRR